MVVSFDYLGEQYSTGVSLEPTAWEGGFAIALRRRRFGRDRWCDSRTPQSVHTGNVEITVFEGHAKVENGALDLHSMHW